MDGKVVIEWFDGIYPQVRTYNRSSTNFQTLLAMKKIKCLKNILPLVPFILLFCSGA